MSMKFISIQKAGHDLNAKVEKNDMKYNRN